MYFLWKISGGDLTILRKCSGATQRVFTLLGVFVMIFHFIVFVGFLCTFLYVMHVIQPTEGEASALSYSLVSSDNLPLYNIGISIVVAAFLTFVFGNIYLLTITTFSRNVLPITKSASSNTFSKILRLGFLVFFAILISKPIEVMLLQGSETMNNDVRVHKQELRNHFAIKNTDDYLAVELGNKIQYTIDNGNFFLYKVALISSTVKYLWTWLLTILFVILFIYPIVVKERLKEDSEYYKKLKEIQVDIIERSYIDFKRNFRVLAANEMDITLEFYEAYEDPPFNTIKKQDQRTFKKQSDFLSLFGAKR